MDIGLRLEYSQIDSQLPLFVFGNKMCILPLKFFFVSHRDPPERDLQDLQERYFSLGIEQCPHQTKCCVNICDTEQ